MRHWELAATQWTEFDSNQEISTSPGEISARLPAGLRPHPHFWCLRQSTWSADKKTMWGKGGQSIAAPLASHFCMSDHLELSISHFWLFTVAKSCQRNSHDNGLLFRKNTASNELAKHRNQVCKTRHHEKLASLKLVQLAPRSFCHAVDGIWEQRSKFNFSTGELRKTSSRYAAPSALVSSSKHLEFLIGDCGDQRTAICHRSSCEWLLHGWPFPTDYFTFLAFQCCQMLSKKQPWQWPLTFEKNTASQRTGQTSQPSLQDEAPWEACFSQVGPAGTLKLLPRSGRNLSATLKVQLLQGRVPQDFQQVCGPIGTFGGLAKAPGVL